MVEAARRLVPLIIASRDEGEQIRRVPSRLAEALAEAGLLQMFLPRSMEGPELDPLTVFHAIEEISKADGSIGWATMIATDVSLALGWLPADIGCQLSGYRELAGFQTDPRRLGRPLRDDRVNAFRRRAALASPNDGPGIVDDAYRGLLEGYIEPDILLLHGCAPVRGDGSTDATNASFRDYRMSRPAH